MKREVGGMRIIPEPTTDPMTIIIADVNPKRRDNPAEVSAVPLKEIDAAITSDCLIEGKFCPKNSFVWRKYNKKA
jgi:hypothetical protein